MDREIVNLDLLIIGGGPAGLTAAVYAARAQMNMILFENQLLGGQIRNSYSNRKLSWLQKCIRR